MNVVPEPVLGLESQPDLSEAPQTPEERVRQFELDWYPWIAQIALKFSVTGVLFFVAYLGIIAFIVNAPSREAWYGMKHDASVWADSLTLASFLSSLSGFLLGIHARRARAGRKAIVVALTTAVLMVAAIVFVPMIYAGAKATF